MFFLYVGCRDLEVMSATMMCCVLLVYFQHTKLQCFYRFMFKKCMSQVCTGICFEGKSTPVFKKDVISVNTCCHIRQCKWTADAWEAETDAWPCVRYFWGRMYGQECLRGSQSHTSLLNVHFSLSGC